MTSGQGLLNAGLAGQQPVHGGVEVVMLIAEHGDFPSNEFEQKLYPRKEMLDAVLDVMECSGRVVPLFFDKHFSWSAELAAAMVQRLESMEVPWFGGSSLAHCPMLPEHSSLVRIHPVLCKWQQAPMNQTTYS